MTVVLSFEKNRYDNKRSLIEFNLFAYKGRATRKPKTRKAEQELTGEERRGFMWKNLRSTWRLVYLQLKLTEFYLLFALDLQKQIQRLSRFFCYSWLACLLGFGLRNAPLWQKVIGNHRFQKQGSFSTSPCWMRKRVEKAEAILPLLHYFH